jgi:hypothetical protein
VNGRHYPAVQIRYISAPFHDFDVLIDDSQVGSIVLTEDMNFELKSDSGWLPAALADVRNSLKQHADFPRALDLPSSSEMAELRLFRASYAELQDRRARSERMGWLIAHDRCVRRVRAVLDEADITCIPCGGVFVVPNRARARAVLLRAGFLPSAISAGALTESFTGSSVYLVERPSTSTRSSRLTS